MVRPRRQSPSLLAAGGAVAGLLLAAFLLDMAVPLLPAPTLPPEADPGLDWRVAGFAAGMALLAGLLCGWLPARYAGRLELMEAMRLQGADSRGGAGGSLARPLLPAAGFRLLVSEIALTFVLVIGGLWVLHSFFDLLRVDSGFRSEQILTFKTYLPPERFTQPHRVLSYAEELLDRLHPLPGVRGAAVTNALPLQGGGTGNDFRALGDLPEAVRRGNARVRTVSPQYLAAMGMRLAAGRFFSLQDGAGSQPSAVVKKTWLAASGVRRARSASRYRSAGFVRPP